MDKDKLIYCGLGIYANTDTGQIFEKAANDQLVEVKDFKTDVELRFIQNHLKDEEVEYDG